MNVGDLFEALAYGELSNISPAQSINRLPNIEPGEIGIENRGRVLLATNDALTQMFTNYVLARETLDMTTEVFTNKYVISAANLVQILYVDVPEHVPYNYIYGNTQYSHHKLRILNKNTIIFDYDLNVPIEVKVEYQVTHPKLTMTGAVLEQVVNIPTYLEEALRALIASKIFSNMSTDVSMARAAEMGNKYATMVAILEARGLIEANVDVNRRDFRESGLA